MPQFKINIDFTGAPDKEMVEFIEAAAVTTLNEVKLSNPVSVNLLIADDQYLQNLNHQYLGYDQATDVLAFPMDEDVDGLEGHLGDIAISMDAVVRQAEEARHSAISELQQLVVHGILHLLGYDHDTEQNRDKMWAIQTKILSQLNSVIQFPASG